MSRNYTDVHFGLAVFPEDFIGKPNDKDDLEDWLADAYRYIDGQEAYGDIVTLKPDRSSDDYDEALCNNGFYIIDLDGWFSLFKAAYPSYEVALNEIKEKAGKYLPADFDYDRRMIEYWGTIYC